MTLWKTIVDTYPELLDADFNPATGIITLIDDGDGIVYIEKWDYKKPIPFGLKLGK